MKITDTGCGTALFSVCYKDLPKAGRPGTRRRYPAGDMEYGIMQKFVRWFTQSKDRGTYMVKKETFECPMGSEVELDEKYAMRLAPVQYMQNKEKSVLN